jgi:hypothetical protein
MSKNKHPEADRLAHLAKRSALRGSPDIGSITKTALEAFRPAIRHPLHTAILDALVDRPGVTWPAYLAVSDALSGINWNAYPAADRA